FGSGSPSIVATEKRLYIEYQLGGPSELRVFDHEGTRLPDPQQLKLASIGGLTALEGDDVLFSNTSFINPPALYRFDAASGRTEKTPLESTSPVDFSDAEVVREFAVSKDGTKVPVNIIFRKGTKRDSNNPALVTGYGGYGISLSPVFSPIRRILLDHG